ncbi:MAG: DUF6134 family protein [Pseudomonadota bacterium]
MRLALLTSVLLSTSIMPASARDLDAKFLIERKGKVIGYHEVRVEPTSDGMRVETDIEMKVKFGPIPVFRYRHDSTEIWRNDEVVSIVARTNNNGDKEFINAKRSGEKLMIEGSAYEGPAPVDAAPSSYWNKDMLSASALISTQNGEIIDITVYDKGETEAPHSQTAEHYFLNGTVGLNIWYDGEKWVGSNFTVDGEELTYVLVDDEQDYASLEEFLN